MATKTLTSFKPRLLQILNERLPLSIAYQNARIGAASGEHQMEAVVQQTMAELLAPHLPAPELIVQNRKVLSTTKLGTCIPDLVLMTTEGDYWGFFELKTLLRSDTLSIAEVTRDLEKLIAYKKKYPEAAAIFSLVGSRSRLFHPKRIKAWSALKINYDRASFISNALRPQVIDSQSKYVAIPCGSYDLDNVDIACFMWEVQPATTSGYALKTEFKFDACMAA